MMILGAGSTAIIVELRAGAGMHGGTVVLESNFPSFVSDRVLRGIIMHSPQKVHGVAKFDTILPHTMQK